VRKNRGQKNVNKKVRNRNKNRNCVNREDREESNRLCLVREANISDSSVRKSEDEHRKKPCEFPDWAEDDISRKQGHKRWKRDNKLREQS
jgi:hypothetical protein